MSEFDAFNREVATQHGAGKPRASLAKRAHYALMDYERSQKRGRAKNARKPRSKRRRWQNAQERAACAALMRTLDTKNAERRWAD